MVQRRTLASLRRLLQIAQAYDRICRGRVSVYFLFR